MEQSYKEIADRHAETHPSPWAYPPEAGAEFFYALCRPHHSPWAYPPEAGAAWPLRSGLGAKAVTHLLHPEGAGRLG